MQMNWIGGETNDENVENLICDPTHKDSILHILPEPTDINCKKCGLGE
jgi:hypothetical protein